MSWLALILGVVGLGAVAGLDFAMRGSGDASLLVALLFWSGLGQGAVALVAAGELAGAVWIAPVKRQLLSLAPALFVLPVAFVIFGRDLSAYSWHDLHHVWLEPSFFVWRNAALLLLTAVAAVLLAAAVNRNWRTRGFWAVVYLFAFAFCQAMAGFDWTMTFAYPWISTMFGPLFFVAALFAGIALAVILAARHYRRGHPDGLTAMHSAATLMFGFSLLWGGLFFAQYLTIWYGNIPEEVSYLYTRIDTQPIAALFVAMIVGYFVIPFPSLVSRWAKQTPAVVVPLAMLVIATFMVEKLVYLIPVCGLSPRLAVLQWILIGLPFVVLLLRHPVQVPTDEAAH